jgi:hypothetical protein
VASARARASEDGEWFVQIGAFKEQAAAKRAAGRLRDMNYPVEESMKRTVAGGSTAPAPRPAVRPTAAAGAPDRYDVLVSGGSASDINARLVAKGLASEPVSDGVRIRPSLALRDAVALSKDLGTDGFKVQVRRAGTAAVAEPAPVMAARSTDDGEALYRVRVGGYPDRASAQRVQRELADKGYQPFIARGRE